MKNPNLKNALLCELTNAITVFSATHSGDTSLRLLSTGEGVSAPAVLAPLTHTTAHPPHPVRKYVFLWQSSGGEDLILCHARAPIIYRYTYSTQGAS